MNWHLQDAKNNLSKLVRMAESEGPQVITRRGERAVVVVSAHDYDRLKRARPNLVDALLSEPAWDERLATDVNERSKLPSRSIAF